MADAGRVIAGSARGRRLETPGEGIRPLGDRVKQTLFAVLEGKAVGAWPVPFLDLFAGSGAGGIEALSRGAPSAVFVELDPRAIRTIETNLTRTGLGSAGRARVVRADALRWLDEPAGLAGGPFGAVLVDPPYVDATLLPALERLGGPDLGWLSHEAVVVAKHFWRDAPPERVANLVLRRSRRLGGTQLSFYVLRSSRREVDEP